MWTRTRMQRSKRPGTPISVKFNNGTSVHPMRRAAAAGNSETRSGVTVKSADATSSGTKPLRSTISRSRRSVASRTSAGSSRATVVAPRIPRTLMAVRSGFRARAAFRRRRSGVGVRDDAPQRRELAFRRGAHRAGGELPERDRSEAQANQRDDRMLHDLEHPAPLPVSPFGPRDFHQRHVAAHG